LIIYKVQAIKIIFLKVNTSKSNRRKYHLNYHYFQNPWFN